MCNGNIFSFSTSQDPHQLNEVGVSKKLAQNMGDQERDEEAEIGTRLSEHPPTRPKSNIFLSNVHGSLKLVSAIVTFVLILTTTLLTNQRTQHITFISGSFDLLCGVCITLLLF
jgi:hypothetical protein